MTPTRGSDLRRVLNGWLLVSGCLVVLGLGAFVAAEATRGATVPAATMEEWRRYAAEVEQGRRTSSPAATRMLTETAIAQHRYATAAQELLRFVGGSLALVGLFLVIDIVRYRARLARGAPFDDVAAPDRAE